MSTFTPFEPSPGNEPAVSSGMVVPQATVAAASAVVAAAALVVAAAAADEDDALVALLLVAVVPPSSEPQPARATRPIPLQGAAGDDPQGAAAGDQGLEVEGEAAIVIVELVVVVMMVVRVHGVSVLPGPKTRLRAR